MIQELAHVGIKTNAPSFKKSQKKVWMQKSFHETNYTELTKDAECTVSQRKYQHITKNEDSEANLQ